MAREDKADPAGFDTAAVQALLTRCRVITSAPLRLADCPTRGEAPSGLTKLSADGLIKAGVARLAALQDLLYANASWSVLVVIQAMDAAGKDGTIKHVMSGVNPQGVYVTSFKAPGPEDLAHEFLWRAGQSVPRKGMIGIFNRSHYEEVLIARVHPAVLARQNLPVALVSRPDFWSRRLDDIAAFERRLTHEGTRILKFYLNVSRDEQKRRFLARLDEPDKTWKLEAADIAERAFWPDYMAAYEAAIAATAGEHTPWFIIPADQKWLMRLLVVQAIVDDLESLDLKPMRATPEQEARLAEARRTLETET